MATHYTAPEHHKRNLLFLLLGSFFIANALIAEFVGTKIFSVEKTLGLKPATLQLFGESYSFNMTAGVVLWPVVFVFTDIINEYFGSKAVKMYSYIAAALISYAFIAVFLIIKLSPADFWQFFQLQNGETVDMNASFALILGQGLFIILGSLVAFLLGQLIDVATFHFIKRKTGEKAIWLRATGSTLVSQFIDSIVVLVIAFYIGPKIAKIHAWPLTQVLAVGIVNYIYKSFIAILSTPVLYLMHSLIDKYLGKSLSDKMLAEAAEK